MTLEDAKNFYFEYLGQSFHMDREEPARYNSFMMLGLGKDTLRLWDEELLDSLFADLRTKPERLWVTHGNILKVIRRNNCDAEKYLSSLLDEMEHMEDLGAADLTLITENMAGRNEALNDGGVYVFCRHPKLAARMNGIMERLTAVHFADPEADERFNQAARRYKSAYLKWNTPGISR